jgi:hypothetical protein
MLTTDWLKEHAKEIPDAKWEIQNINNNPYHTASDKINKLPNDHFQASEGPGLGLKNKCPD